MLDPPFPFQPSDQLTNPLTRDPEPLAERRLRESNASVEEVPSACVIQTAEQIMQNPMRLVALDPMRPFHSKRGRRRPDLVQRKRIPTHAPPLLVGTKQQS